MSKGFQKIDEVVIDHVWIAMRFCTSSIELSCNEDALEMLDIDATVKDLARVKSTRRSTKIGTAI